MAQLVAQVWQPPNEAPRPPPLGADHAVPRFLHPTQLPVAAATERIKTSSGLYVGARIPWAAHDMCLRLLEQEGAIPRHIVYNKSGSKGMYHAYCCLNKQRSQQGKPSCPWQVRFKDVEPRLTDDGTEERMVEVYKLSPDHDHHPLCGLWMLEANAAHLAAKHRAIRRGPGTTHMVCAELQQEIAGGSSMKLKAIAERMASKGVRVTASMAYTAKQLAMRAMATAVVEGPANWNKNIQDAYASSGDSSDGNRDDSSNDSSDEEQQQQQQHRPKKAKTTEQLKPCIKALFRPNDLNCLEAKLVSKGLTEVEGLRGIFKYICKHDYGSLMRELMQMGFTPPEAAKVTAAVERMMQSAGEEEEEASS